MKITPLEIRQHEFEKTFRGYNIEEVDNFLSNLAQEWERVLNDSKMLRMQLEIAEKEANKLREIEMTLFKTLKTAEDTSTMITEQANQQAEKNISEAKLQGETIIQDAHQKAATIIRQAEEKAKYVKEEVLGEVKVLERDFKAMDHYKNNLMVQMRSLANATIDHVDRFEAKFDKEGIDAKFKEATTLIEAEDAASIAPVEVVEPNVEVVEEVVVNELVEESTENTVAQEASETVENAVAEVNESIEAATETTEEATSIEESVVEPVAEVTESIVETTSELTENIEEVAETASESLTETVEAPTESVTIESSANIFADRIAAEAPKIDDLEIIEGIGPKIADILRENGIISFADLAKTPSFKVKEILVEAGPQFARHDPTTWTEQALLAATGRFEELEVLKEKLHAGRHVEEDVVVEATPLVVEKVAEVFAEPVIETPPTPVAEPIVAETPAEAITEDMLEKVNKVKAAIRKAMAEKAESQQKDTTPLTTVNDVMAKNEGGSFFDNI
jgi:DivIVA domain-containing protein